MPRRKISKAATGAKLTPKQLKFCEGILAGMSQSDAYRAAYDCQNMSLPAIHVNASRLRHDAKIALWLDASTYAVLGHSKEEHIKRLARLIEIGIRTGNVGAAVQAEQLIGKACGHYVEQFADVTYDPIATLHEIAASGEDGAELARKLADLHGISWQDTNKPANATQH